MNMIPLLMLLLQLAPPSPQIAVPDLAPPVRQSPPVTASESPILRDGIALYDQGKYDDAQFLFEQVLKSNPANTVAMYELAQTYLQKRELQKAMDMAVKGTEYSSPDLPNFYAFIGNILDSQRQTPKAIEIYKKGIALNTPNQGVLFLNMGVSYQSGMKDIASAKLSFKQGALADPNYPGDHYQLGTIYLAQGLKTAVFLADSRFLVLEPGSMRAQRVYGAWRAMLDNLATPQVAQGNPYYEYVHSPQQTFEGDLTQLDASLVSSKAAAVGPGKSPIQTLIDQVDNLFGTYSAIRPSDNDKDTFLWKYYIPYAIEMKQKGHVEAFVYFVNQGAGNPAVREWLTANPDRVNAFLLWTRTYHWPDKNSVDAAR